MNISIYTFDQLTPSRLYDILQLRQHVFIIEQQSIYDDIDGNDTPAFHVCAEQQDKLFGYTRVRPLTEKKLVKIERVVLAQSARGKGIGAQMMERALGLCKEKCAEYAVSLSSQNTMIPFYQRYGFVVQGEPYDDGGILHTDMVLKSAHTDN